VNRGELYRVFKKGGVDPRRSRVFVIVSRQVLIDSKFSTVVCAPIYSKRLGLATQVDVGPENGLKQDCCIHCDELISLPKASLTNYVGTLSEIKLHKLRTALRLALGVE
jgi:mRNA interferase MazF